MNKRNGTGPIAESELILNPDGSIYHINLKPEHVGDIIITGGDPNRIAVISKYFDTVDFKTSKREFVTHCGTLNGKRITAISTGIGTDNIDIVFNEIDALVNIDLETKTVKKELKSLLFFRMGTSGGLQPDLDVDSVVVSSHGIGLDNLMLNYQRENNPEESAILNAFINQMDLAQEPLNPYIASGSESLLHSFGNKFHKGITVTCSGFYGPQGRRLRLEPSLPHLIDRLPEFSYGDHRITNFEMETSGIYGLGELLGHQCLSINTVIANRVNRKFSNDPYQAVESMIENSLEVIAGL